MTTNANNVNVDDLVKVLHSQTKEIRALSLSIECLAIAIQNMVEGNSDIEDSCNTKYLNGDKI